LHRPANSTYLPAVDRAASGMKVQILPGESWWGGAVSDAPQMPYTEAAHFSRSLIGSTCGNQAQPFLLSNLGRYIYSHEPFSFEFVDGNLHLSGPQEFTVEHPGHTLHAAFLAAQARYFQASGQIPDASLFRQAQFNTWIELTYHHNQKDIEAYAQAIVAKGYSPGVLMIDDTWQEAYGVWQFHAGRFPDPKGMLQRLHALGFKVMLWVVPYVSPDSAEYRGLAAQGALIREDRRAEVAAHFGDKPALFRWWNGVSALLDLTNPSALRWLKTQLTRLETDYGIDGFKFDAGDADAIENSLWPNLKYNLPSNGNDQSERFAQFGVQYPLNEYRACWKAGGQPLAQRLKDKDHTWDALRTLLPSGLAQGLMGYPFTCPDMIGGGEYRSFESAESIDQELVVRSAQASALFPMMQFSAAPWRILDEQHQAYCLSAAQLHAEFADEILALAANAARTGEPILRHLEYVFPRQGFAAVSDQFLLGDILVAPVLAAGAIERDVIFPHGKWRSADGELFEGPCKRLISAPLARLPWFRRV